MTFDYISAGWFLVLFLSLWILRTSSFLDLPILYIFIYSALSSFLPISFWNRTIQMSVGIENEQKTIMCLCVILICLLKTKFNPEKFLKTYFWAILFGTVISIPFQNEHISGLVPNKGMNGILLASLLPYCDNIYGIILAPILILVFSHSSSAFLALLGLLFFAGLFSKHKKHVLILGALTLLSGILLVPSLLDPGSRLRGYSFFFSGFKFNDFVIGRGPGSFYIESIKLQALSGFDKDVGFWLWMHSDPLQLIYEYGLIGLTILAVTIYGIYKNIQIKPVLSLVAMSFGSFFYYPYHQPLHLLTIFLNLKIVYDFNKTKSVL